jgi:hypothetical protein
MRQFGPDIYFAFGIEKGKLLLPYDPFLDKEKIKEFYSWLKTVRSFSFKNQDSFNLQRYLSILEKEHIDFVGVCGAYEDSSVALATSVFLNSGLNVSVPKKYIFKKENSSGLLARLSEIIDSPLSIYPDRLAVENRKQMIESLNNLNISYFEEEFFKTFNPESSKRVSFLEKEDSYFFYRENV